MVNDTKKTLKKQLIKISFSQNENSSNPLSKFSQNLLVATREAYKFIKDVDVIFPYQHRLITITDLSTFKKEANLLKEMFTRNVFNLLHYINRQAGSFTAYIHTGKDLTQFLEIIKSDVSFGFLPCYYSISYAMNLKNTKKYRRTIWQNSIEYF